MGVTHLSAVCRPALCSATAAETDPGTQEVEHLALPLLCMCVAKAPSLKHMDKCKVDVLTNTQHLSQTDSHDNKDQITSVSPVTESRSEGGRGQNM